jgi:peptidoglycan-N-acetylglucosamine deacetylase
MWTAKTPEIIKPLAGELVWDIHPVANEVFLTFDDGPTQGVTDRALDILKEFDARATFFFLGKNVLAYPDLAQRAKREGHAIGNHTFSHPNGFETEARAYWRQYVMGKTLTSDRLFRPPYGRITRAQAKPILRQCHVVMWDVLSGDFDSKVTVESCVRNVLANAKAGSIIVMHDSQKAAPVMLPALRDILPGLMAAGLKCEPLTEEFLPSKKQG